MSIVGGFDDGGENVSLKALMCRKESLGPSNWDLLQEIVLILRLEPAFWAFFEFEY